MKPFAGHSPDQERPLGSYAVLTIFFGAEMLQLIYKKAEDALPS